MSGPDVVAPIPAVPPVTPVQPDFWTRHEAAAIARLKSAKHLDKLIRDAKAQGRPLPPKVKLNRKLTLYPRVGFLEWINQHQVTGAALPKVKRRRGRPRKPIASDTPHTKSGKSRKASSR